MASKKALKLKIEQLKSDVKSLENMRPQWAQSYTIDTAAANGSNNALSELWELWELLCVSNQTEAVAVLKKMNIRFI
jgi:hypothetical protein